MKFLNFQRVKKLSSTYKIKDGDTFARISRFNYGYEKYALLIKKSNPGVVEPLRAGTIISIPDIPDIPTDSSQIAPFSNIDEVAILIEGKRFRFWSEVRITRSIDNIDVVEFSAPFEPENEDFKAIFQPMTFKPMTLTVGGVTIFTGTMVGVVPDLSNGSRTVQVSCYSTPGVLNDCTPPDSASDTLEFIDVDLKGIATSLCEPFGVGVQFNALPGDKFEQIAIEQSEKIWGFLSNLARQRNLIASNTTDGKLLFDQSTESGIAVANLSDGVSPLLSVTPFFSAQEYYSAISGVEPILVGSAGSSITVRNSRLNGVTRPFTFTAEDTEGGNLKDAVEAKAGRMFGNSASYSINVVGWRDVNGELWQPNTKINLHAEGVMIYNPYDFVVRSVEYLTDGQSQVATLNLVIPGSFSGKIPEVLPWDV